MLNLPIPIEEYFQYHPVVSSHREEAHNAINGAALRLALSLENDDNFEQRLVEFKRVAEEKVSDSLTTNWAFAELEKVEKIYNESELNYETKLEIVRLIQLVRMFLNQSATIDEILEGNVKKPNLIELINYKITQLDDTSEISDGYYTFKSLYEQRVAWNAAAVNLAAKMGVGDPGKSLRHHDGELCFGDEEWFIVEMMTENGLVTNHYQLEYWNYFHISERETAKYPFDGHTADDVCKRLLNWFN